MADAPFVQPKNAPPATYRAPAPLPAQGAFWAMRQGNDLVVQNLAHLPDVCVKCGKRGDVLRRRQNFVWFPKWVLWLLLVNVIVTAVVMQVMQKKGQLSLPLCRECKSRWSTANLFLGFSILGIIAGLIVGGVLLANDLSVLGALTMVSAIAAPIVVSAAVVKPRTIRPKIIKDLLLTLTGVHPEAADAIVQASKGEVAQLPALALQDGAISPPR